MFRNSELIPAGGRCSCCARPRADRASGGDSPKHMNEPELPPVSREPKDVRALLTGESFKAKIASALPKHLTADRMVRVACTAAQKTPKLLQCTPQSFLLAMLNLSAAGLEPDGRRAHLIPYGT